MADLLIKPNTGSGNKLILQDQAGNAVLTTADSGVSIAAPTIADLSNVTGTLPVGVTGGSGLTAMAGVTTGSGSVTITNGDLVFGTADKGICLGATSNTDANTLDDYEEGTWTPVIKSYTTNTIITFTGGTQTFTYIKVGDICTLYFQIIGATASTASGNEVVVTGYPFTSAQTGVGTPILLHSGGIDLTSDAVPVISQSATSGQYMSFAGSGYAFPNITGSGTTYMYWQMTYRTT